MNFSFSVIGRSGISSFFEDGANFVVWAALNGVNVTVACLNADSNAQGWSEVDKLFHHVDEVVKLSAVCSCCGNQEATYSYFNGTKNDKTVVGDEEYEPLCRSCYYSRILGKNVLNLVENPDSVEEQIEGNS